MAEVFYTGPIEYTTGWESNELVINETISVSSAGGGDNRVLSDFYTIPDYPTGEGYSNEYKFEFHYSYVISGYSPQNRYSVNECWVTSGPLLWAFDNNPCFVYKRPRGPLSWNISSGTIIKSTTGMISGDCRFKVDAATEWGLNGTAYTALTLIKFVCWRGTKVAKVVPVVKYGWWRTNSIDYTIGDVSMVAEGTINFLAVSR